MKVVLTKTIKLNCRNCKYYREIITQYEQTKLCTLYMFASTPREPEIKYIEASYCRNNDSLCGPGAKHFKQK